MNKIKNIFHHPLLPLLQLSHKKMKMREFFFVHVPLSILGSKNSAVMPKILIFKKKNYREEFFFSFPKKKNLSTVREKS